MPNSDIGSKNPYYNFLKKLLESDFRMSINTFAAEFKLNSFSSIMSALKDSPDRKLNPNTLKQIEEALNIIIDDSNPAHILYTRKGQGTSHHRYPILSTIYVREPEMLKDASSKFTYFNYREDRLHCYVLEVDNTYDLLNMEGQIKQGDSILIDMDEPLIEDNVYICKLLSGRILLRFYKKVDHDKIALYAGNQLDIIEEKDVVKISRVVKVSKNL